ncbi:MAG: hypothetical protein NZ528_15035 [Caldilineales bacterium]|nr:hypothetical protein [Caldilineales bacterium]MDW8317443.1 hypothetical protein [Anaerolineae bacterium]
MKSAQRMTILLIVLALLLGACGGGGQPAPTAAVAQNTPAAVPATPEPTPTATQEPATPTPAPTNTPTSAPTATPTPEPTATPTPEPTATPTPEPPAAPSACNNPYLPVAVGRQWVYQITGMGTNNRFTRSITAVTENGFKDRDEFDVGTVREGEWRCENGNLTALTPSSQAAVSIPEVRFTFTVESNEGVTLPADLAPGKTWSQRIIYSGRQTMGDLTMDTRNDLTTSCKAVREEQVTVPAGTFTALRVECTYAMRITVQSLTIPVDSTSVGWWAKNVGWLKSTDQTDQGTVETVLLEYSQ